MTRRRLVNVAQVVDPGDKREPGDSPFSDGTTGSLLSRPSVNCTMLVVWIGACCLLLAARPACAAEPAWARFRGPNGAGISQADSVPAAWTTADYRWRVKLPGIGHSSPVVCGDRLFITSCVPDEPARIVRCLRTSDGGLIWKRSFAAVSHSMHQYNTYAVTTPALDAEKLYLSWASPEQYEVVALDQQKGREVWRRELGPFIAQHGFGSSPMLFADKVIVAGDQEPPGESFVAALDRATGEVVWRTKRRSAKAAYATPCLFQPADGPAQLIVTSTAHGMSGLDPNTGRVLWELADVFTQRIVASPVVAGELVIGSCGVGRQGTRLIAVRPGQPDKGLKPEIVYEVKGSLPYVCTPVVADGLLFLWSDQGVVTCADALSGEVRWRERVGGTFFGSPVWVAGRLYCMSREGEMVVLKAADRYEPLARFSLEEPTNATPALADGVMYLRTLSHLMAIGGHAEQQAAAPAGPAAE